MDDRRKEIRRDEGLIEGRAKEEQRKCRRYARELEKMYAVERVG